MFWTHLVARPITLDLQADSQYLEKN